MIGMTKMLARVALQLINKIPKNLSPAVNWKGFMAHPHGNRLSKIAKNYGDGSLKNLLGDARNYVQSSHLKGRIMTNKTLSSRALDEVSAPFASKSIKYKPGFKSADRLSKKNWDKHWDAERKVEKYFDDLTMKKIKSSTGNIGIPRKEWDRLAKRVTKAKTPKRHSLQGMMDDIGITKHQSKFTRDDPIFDYKWLDKLSNKLTTALRKENYETAESITSMMKGSKPHKDFDIEGLIGQIIRNYKGS